MIGPVLRAALLAQPAVAALVGTRVYPEQLPQNPTLPAITYTGAGGTRGLSISSVGGIRRWRMQVDCWASSYDGAMALADAVEVLHGFSGFVGGKDVQLVSQIGPPADHSEPDVKLYRAMVEFYVFQKEEAA